MTVEPPKIDPRVRRTRQMLFQALQNLLAEKAFDLISVQDIAERSTLNRATFYDHFTDKFALLEAMIGERVNALIASRMAENEAGRKTKQAKEPDQGVRFNQQNPREKPLRRVLRNGRNLTLQETCRAAE